MRLLRYLMAIGLYALALPPFIVGLCIMTAAGTVWPPKKDHPLSVRARRPHNGDSPSPN